jgi:biofilm PGA synthesis protein PgaD
MKASERLILRSRAQPPLQRSLATLLTLAAWSIYAYLWLPLVTALLWMFGLRTSYVKLYLEQQSADFPLIGHLLGLSVICAVSLIGWAEYNRVRFQGRARRGPSTNATLADVATPLGVAHEHARLMQQARVISIVMTDQATPIDVRASDGPLSRRADAVPARLAAEESA